MLLTCNGFDPKSSAKPKVSSSVIWFGEASAVFTPINPCFKYKLNLYLVSVTIWLKLSLKVKSVATIILSFESRAIPLLLNNFCLFGSIGLSSCILIVYPKYISWKLPNLSLGSASITCFWL
jgi:hypothetical protein